MECFQMVWSQLVWFKGGYLIFPSYGFSLGARRPSRRREGLVFLSAVFSKLQRILLSRSCVMSLSYAGGDGGSNLFQHVGDMSKACKVVVYGSSAAVRRPSSLWTVSLWFFG
ncbi:hypothetical protein IGI04_024864 [Brassica rapa subsp. trilocularis]|uniref:Uncharacterized protein n=1 Tax=Brassica rapa subsp. trilocularis TaxID=1813537 RepID=A0ABQ7MAC1_BRACM|nr:hypothetical protein IGI04_024864 [Brassica rapa subsp. trilocularis]